MILLTRRYRFSASHRLHSPALSEEENAATYGKCSSPYGHGHDYTLEVSVCGPVDRETGRVVDVAALDRLVECEALAKLRHRDLNSEVAALEGKVPTTEILAEGIGGILARAWRNAFPDGAPSLERIRIHETRRNRFEVSKFT
jgi:6-pyruvoyltetrahydropterin/6-carboxytetrahydropterin synthase